MLNAFDQLKCFFTVRRINTDGFVFKLHYRATVCIILVFCLMVAARQYVGDPIKCIHGKDLPHDVIDTFCWVHATFSIKSAFLKKVGIDISYPGIENSLAGQKPRKEHRYYQWVVFFLLLQVSGCLRHRKKLTVFWHVTTCRLIDGSESTTSEYTPDSRFFRNADTCLPKHVVTSQKNLPLIVTAEWTSNFTKRKILPVNMYGWDTWCYLTTLFETAEFGER
jgi:hypothetical protein